MLLPFDRLGELTPYHTTVGSPPACACAADAMACTAAAGTVASARGKARSMIGNATMESARAHIPTPVVILLMVISSF
jgi:hypothetical protein